MRSRVRHHPGHVFPTPPAANPAGQDLTTETTTGRDEDRTTPPPAELSDNPFVPVAVIVPDPVTSQAEPATSTTAPQNPPPTESSFVPLRATTPVGYLPEAVCASGTTGADLTAFFDGGNPLIGADYQRAYPLPDGRVLWLFQDAFLPTTRGPYLVHNVGLLQSGPCFQLLRNGSADGPTPYLLPELTDRYDRWFWPLGGELGEDGDLHVFVAEMVEHGPRYLTHVEPIATWLLTIDVGDLSVVESHLAPNSSPELYGWSVVSQGDHTYLYAHCYRQFGWDLFPFADPPFRAHDWECGPDVSVARVSRGEFDTDPDYWNGSEWVTDPAAAVPVIPRDGRPVNPTQVALLDGRFVAVTKVGDWWGDTIALDVASAAEGPWRTVDTIPVEPECDTCNTYFASVVPYGADQSSFVVGLSCNTWGPQDHDHYTPTFLQVPMPA